jgi:hypothetical protein
MSNPQAETDGVTFENLATLGNGEHEARCLPGRNRRIFGGQKPAPRLSAGVNRPEVNPVTFFMTPGQGVADLPGSV